MSLAAKMKADSEGRGSAVPQEEILFGRTAAMAEVRKRAEKLCQTNVPILLCGGAGTGKETLARWLHAHSKYAQGEFVKVNCAAIPGTLLESELFGYERGAFTGAQTSKPGRVELADKGTLFLDEIADLDAAIQSKLLHFLQDGRFSRVGDQVERCVDARIICSTNKDLAKEIAQEKFRADLFYRISVVELRLPLLKDRKEDIPGIAEYLRSVYEKEFAKESAPLGAEILNYMKSLSWPGNMRELANGIARYVLIGPEAVVGQEQRSRQIRKWSGTPGAEHQVPFKRLANDAIRAMERRVILEALQANQWNRRRTAQALKISYRALIYKIRHAGLASRGEAPSSGGAEGMPGLRSPSTD